MGIAASTSHFCSSSAADLPVILRQSLKSAVSQHVFLWSTTKMFAAELVTSGNMVQLKNGVCFILPEAKVGGGGEKKILKAFSFLKV